MPITETNEKPQGAARTIVNSLAAGVAAMTVLGAMASFVVKGGLDTPAAAASTPAEQAFANAPAVRPLDVKAVQAQLDLAAANMRVTQDATDTAMSRLERLSGR
ncbi:MAG: hypothetical protein ABW199_05690 [Caulobacterales bacterium]